MAPQIIVLILQVLGIGIILAKHGQDKKAEKYNVFRTLFYMLINMSLLYWGGFFDVLIN